MSGCVVTVSMRVMSAGTGYRYLLKSVVVGDGNRDLSTPLTDYYIGEGTPPGVWLGSGVADLGDGRLRPGDQVTEDQLGLLLGTGCDPLTGTALGRAFPDYQTRSQRIHARIEGLDGTLNQEDRQVAVKTIEAEESAGPQRRAVAGFDLTFSVPKSVSVLWALADPDIQAQVIAAHHAAIADVLRLMEAEVAATRTGTTATDGAVAQVAVTGLIATAYDHYDSRAGDPQLHTHVVVSNKVKTVSDGKWRSLDSRPVHGAAVAMSEHYNAVLADHLTRTVGVAWDQRPRGQDRNPAWEIAGIPDTLINTFSSRSGDIEAEKDRLIGDYLTRHGHQPSPTTIIKLRAQATLATRPDKTIRSLADLTTRWRSQAAQVTDIDPAEWPRRCRRAGPVRPLIAAADVPTETVEQIGQQVVTVVGEKRSTWRRWNLHAEASRQLMGWRFATTTDRQTVLGSIVDAAERSSLRLTPPDLAATPVAFTRADGSSMFRPKHTTVFTSTELLAAEDRLMQLGRAKTGPAVPVRNLDLAATMADHDGHTLGEDQVAAITAIATSGRVVDVLVGPAGAGKTTAMHALRSAWELSHGPDSVVGLAPSAAAAQILASDLGIATDNTAKWLHDRTRNTTAVRTGQLVIIDEASLAGTRTLDAISAHAGQVGAKVLLVGDFAQLAAVDAGGAFGLLARDRPNPPQLTGVHRFAHTWEKRASVQLRNGDPSVIDTYQANGRIHEGDSDTMLDATFQAWRDDVAAGRSSVMIAATRADVAQLNLRARTDRIASGQSDPPRTVALHDQSLASTGDTIVTRRNNRRLQAGRGWVKNGDRWIITAINHDASLSVHRAGQNPGQSVRLPADYVAAHVELGYALTAHRAQGATVDTAHTIVRPGMTRETLYVAMTRGRQTNTVYVTTDQPDHEPHHSPDTTTATSVLQAVLRHVGADQSAHQTLEAEHDRWSTITQLAAEYETIAAAAQQHRWTALIRQSGLTAEQADKVITSDAFGPLAAALRRADAHHHDVESLLPRLVAARPVGDAEDPAAVLHHRLSMAATRRTPTRQPRPKPRLIAGLIPHATGPMTAEMRQALAERKQLIEQRARAVTERAIADQEPWTRALGTPPRDPNARKAWIDHVQTIAAYRDRYQITSGNILGSKPVTGTSQVVDASRARVAVRDAQRLSRPGHPPYTSYASRTARRPSTPSL